MQEEWSHIDLKPNSQSVFRVEIGSESFHFHPLSFQGSARLSSEGRSRKDDYDAEKEITMKSKITIIILSIVLLLSFTVNSLGADNVIHSFTYNPSGFRLGVVNNPLENYTLYDYSSTTYPFVKYATAFNIGEASYRYYVDYKINNDFSIYTGSKYILLSCTVAINTLLTDNNLSYFYFYRSDGSIYKYQLSGDRTTEVISLLFQGIEMNYYSNYFVLQVDDITDFAQNVAQVSYNHYIDVLGPESKVIFMSPLTIDIYDDINDVVDSINTSVDIIKKQNDVIIRNQQEVIEKIEDIMNFGPSDEDVSDVNSFFDNENSINESVDNLEESMNDKVNQGFDQSIDMNTSGAESTVEKVFQNTDVKTFFNHLYGLPIVAFAFTILPTFWIAYIVLFRG